MRKFVVDDKLKIIVNIIEVDPNDLPVIPGHSLHDADGKEGNSGWAWDAVNNIPIAPPAPPPETPEETDTRKTERSDGMTNAGLLAVAKLSDPTMTTRKLAALIKAEL